MESRVTPAGQRLPEGRYGTRANRRLSRTARWALVAVGLALACGVAYVGYRNLGSAPIEAQRVGYAVLGPDTIRIDISVTRDEPQRPAACVVRARGHSAAENGRREVLVPAGGSTVGVSSVIRSSGEPVTADVVGCTYQVPPYLSTEAPPTE